MPLTMQRIAFALCFLACRGDGLRVRAGSNKLSPSPVRLDFDSITLTVGKKRVLDECTGTALPGRILAIMGPSGGGKTTLLNALAGRVKRSASSALTGTLLVNGKKCGGASQVPGLRMAYVPQDDIFYKQMTVRETLLFTARLRLPSSMPLATKARRVEDLIATLGLVDAANTIVGDAERRGISGGERKRLAIGCELLSDPQLLFLDEPTSGLDSFAAQQVVNLLRVLSDRGTTVVMAIHQPRGSIFNLFDDLLLLARGRVVYCGSAQHASSHFAALGYRCPIGINPGEYLVDLVSTGYDPERADERQSKFEKAAKKPQTHVATSESSRSVPPLQLVSRSSSSVLTQYRLLFRRALREVARSRSVLSIKVMQQVMISLIYGGIYSLNDGQSSIQDRFGLLSLMAIGAGNMAIVSNIRAFPKEKIIVDNERAKGMYSVTPYFLSKVIAEAPISALVSSLGGAVLYPLVGLNPGPGKFFNYLCTLVLEGLTSGALGLLIGASAPNTDMAMALFPPIFVLNVVFNGFNIAAENVPLCLRWVPKVSFIRWCFEGLAVNEFSGLIFSCDRRGPCFKTGEEALERMSLGGMTVRTAAIAQVKLLATFYLATYFMLQRNMPKFLSIQPPSAAQPRTEASKDP